MSIIKCPICNEGNVVESRHIIKSLCVIKNSWGFYDSPGSDITKIVCTFCGYEWDNISKLIDMWRKHNE